MTWKKLSININIRRLFKNYKIFFLGTAIFLFAITVVITNAEKILKFTYEESSSKYTKLLNIHIEKDINELKQVAQAISGLEDVRRYIKENNTDQLAELLNEEKKPED